MKTKIILFASFLLSILIDVSGQHCTFESTSVCIISIDKPFSKHRKRFTIRLVDSVGNVLTDHFSNERVVYFGRADKLRFGDYFYSLARQATVKKNDYFLLLPTHYLDTMFQKRRYCFLQIQSKKGELLSQTSMTKVAKEHFEVACTGMTYWKNEKEMDSRRLRIYLRDESSKKEKRFKPGGH